MSTVGVKIARLEPGRELDALVAEQVMGWKFTKPTHGTCCTCQRCGRDQDSCFANSCEFSSEIEAAWQVVEKVRNLHISDSIIKPEFHVMASPYDPVYYAGWLTSDEFRHHWTYGKTAPHAICLAALAAVGVK